MSNNIKLARAFYGRHNGPIGHEIKWDSAWAGGVQHQLLKLAAWLIFSLSAKILTFRAAGSAICSPFGGRRIDLRRAAAPATILICMHTSLKERGSTLCVFKKRLSGTALICSSTRWSFHLREINFCINGEQTQYWFRSAREKNALVFSSLSLVCSAPSHSADERSFRGKKSRQLCAKENCWIRSIFWCTGQRAGGVCWE